MYYINKYDNTSYVGITGYGEPWSFSYWDRILTMNINITLYGNYNLPHNVLKLDLYTNFGTIENINLNLVSSGSNTYKYDAILNIKIDDTTLKEDAFAKKVKFIGKLKLDYDLINNLNLKNLDEFIMDLNEIVIKDELLFSNYYPISMLDSQYLYFEDYRYIDVDGRVILNSSNFKWYTPSMWYYPQTYMEKAYSSLDNLYDQSILHLYRTVYISGGQLNFLFNENFKASIMYKTIYDDEYKQLDFKFNDRSLEIIKPVSTYLNVYTMYNFETNELYQTDNSNMSVHGIFFPVITSGYLNISFDYEGMTYKDTLPFSFSQNFYSDTNRNLKFTLEKLDNVEGYWYRTYAN